MSFWIRQFPKIGAASLAKGLMGCVEVNWLSFFPLPGSGWAELRISIASLLISHAFC